MEDKQDSPETRRRAAAHRALEEAQARRKEKAAQHNAYQPKETGGQKGPEPTRYGDWEKEGIISDF